MTHAANDNVPIASRIRYAVEPRLVPPEKAARRLHLRASDFHTMRPALEAAGFPRPCDITGHYDLKAIDGWQDNRSGLTVTAITSNAADLVAARLAAIV